MKRQSNAGELGSATARLIEGDRTIHSLGIVIESADASSATASMEVKEFMLNGLGVCHGGFIFTLADTALAYASNSGQPATVSTNVTIDFIRSAAIGDRLTAVATRRHASRRNALYHIDVTRADGTLVATLSGRVVVVTNPPGREPAVQ